MKIDTSTTEINHPSNTYTYVSSHHNFNVNPDHINRRQKRRAKERKIKGKRKYGF